MCNFLSVFWIVIHLLQVLEVMRRCILLSSDTGKLGPVVHNMLLSDASIHSTLFRVVCTTRHALEVCLKCSLCISLAYWFFYCWWWHGGYIHQKLYVSRLYEPREIEGLENAICSVLDTLFIMLSAFSKVFHDSITFF